MFVSLFGVGLRNRCWSRWITWHWKGPAVFAPSLKTRVTFDRHVKNKILIMFISADWVFFLCFPPFFCRPASRRKFRISDCIFHPNQASPLCRWRSSSPSLLLAAMPVITSQFSQTKPFSCTWFCLLHLFIGVNWVAGLCWDTTRFFASVSLLLAFSLDVCRDLCLLLCEIRLVLHY